MQPGSDRSQRNTRAGTVAALIATIALGLAWALASPLNSSPDDDLHLGSIWCAWGYDESNCRFIERERTIGDRDVADVPTLRGESLCFAPSPSESAACQESAAPAYFYANSPAYPRGFYVVMRLFAGDNAGASVLLMRMFSFLFSALMLVGAALLLRRVEAYRVLLLWLAAAVPLGLFLMASTNPSGVAIAAEAAVFASAVAALRSKTWRQGLLLAAACTGYVLIAVAVRSDGLFLSAVSLTAAAVTAVQPRWFDPRRSRIHAAALYGAAAMILLLLIGAGATGRVTLPDYFPNGLDEASAWLNRALSFTDFHLGSDAVVLGWRDTPMPFAVGLIRAMILGAAFAFAYRTMSRRRTLAVVFLGSMLFVLPVAWEASGGFTLQPRYLLAPLLVLFALLGLTLQRSSGAFTRSQGLLLAALAAIANGVALHVNIRRYVTGNDVISWDLDASREWWWNTALFGPNLVWLMGTVSFAVVAAVIAARASSLPSPEQATEEGAESLDDLDASSEPNTIAIETTTRSAEPAGVSGAPRSLRGSQGAE